MRLKLVQWLAVAIVMYIAPVLAVDRSKFRTCEQTQFCHKHRFDVAGHGDYHVLPSSVALNGHTLHFDLQQGAITSNNIATERLQGTLVFVFNASASSVPALRLHVSEKWENPNDPKKRWENPDVLQPDAFTTRALTQVTVEESGLVHINRETTVLFKPLQSSADVLVAFHLAPFGVDVYLNKRLVISTNTEHQMHYEHRRERPTISETESTDASAPVKEEDVHGGKTIVDYGEDGLAIYSDGTVQEKEKASPPPSSSSPSSSLSEEGWEESFGGHTDKKKYGPSSLGLDISFHGTGTSRPVYGIPEHATDFLLKDTIEFNTKQVLSDPYRLYNLDVFEYELDVPMTLYGSIPVLISPFTDSTVGIFWHNPSETFVDIKTSPERTSSHWISESGVLDLFFILGPTSIDWFQQYTRLTGRASLPPLFAIGYHQCRWNYKNELDVERVDAGFDQHLIPYDVLWLDIEHTDGKRYFTWDVHAFPTPREMQERIARTGRKMVTIVDPHIKVDSNYRIHQQATADNVYIKEEDGITDFRGWCWPGDSSYVDFTSSRARRWWSKRFHYDQYEGSTEELYTWNDMNEPSVFNGPEVSMRKTCLNEKGMEHREWHNLYGYYMHQATMEGQLIRQLPSLTELTTDKIPITKDMLRPFVLSRAFFAGTQRFGAIWTGDNKADWGHLAYATKMLLSMSVTGLTFVGADVGGFFGNPDTELLTRWYQAAVYQPFFRGHAHHDSNRREPWVFGEPHTNRIRSAIRERYAILPYLYTLFATCFQTGTPVMRPLWMHFPLETTSFTIEDEFLLGSDLLVKPITTPGTVETSVFLPSDKETTVWYHLTHHYKRYNAGTIHNIPAPIDATPVFQRGGAVIPRKNRVRRSSSLMSNDPYTLVITLDPTMQAQGTLYVDDGETFAYSEQLDRAYTIVQYTVTRTGMQATVTHNRFESRAWIERIEIYGFNQGTVPKQVTLNDASVLEATYDLNKDQFVIRKPNVSATGSWTIEWK